MKKPNLFSILRKRGYSVTTDIAITFQMQAFFAGEVNRSHPVAVEPNIQDVNAPLTFYGQPCLIDVGVTGGTRPLVAGDIALTAIYGVLARPFPAQQQTTNQPFGAIGLGAGAPPPSGIVDIVRSGYIAVPVNGVTAKGGSVFIWVAASAGNHVQGGFESVATGGSTIALDSRSTYNGVTNAQGLVELAFNI